MGMTQNGFEVGGRHFRTKADYTRALRDQATIDKIKKSVNMEDRASLEKLKKELASGKIRFLTLLGDDFREEVDACLKKCEALKKQQVENLARVELGKRDKRRRLIIALCCVGAALCLGYVGIYSWFGKRTEESYKELAALKEKPAEDIEEDSGPLYTLDEETGDKEVLDEYKNLLRKYKKLIGWLKIDDTNIDYPVVQTSDNEFYLDHNIDEAYDRNGTIFLDKDCDAMKPSTNLILYGHHMQSGKMFGNLGKYEQESYFKEHPYIQFDTIYEKGTYQVMYVFRSRVYKEDEIVFKYYQFIDANGETEFNSNMEEMASMSLYDTGVTAEYGDRLLTLSTCDYEEKDGRFVVVAKKILEE